MAKERFVDKLGSFLWDEVFGRSETRPAVFQMSDAWQFFLEVAQKHPHVAKCVLNIEPKGERFVIMQLMIDANGELIKDGASSYLGRRIVAEALDESVPKFMMGETRKTMEIPK